ncbi:MAG: hypothetical protein FJX74_05570 [Armatimonadetes bacterium]|nr:hypothetical protein [Armatimonadota bacterium]
MSERAVVDTQIWEYAWVEEDRAPATVHREAAAFLTPFLDASDKVLCVTAYQAAEIMDVLRKAGLDADARGELLDLLQTQCLCLDLTTDAVFECVEMSLRSGIHVYDYLVAVPLRGLIDVIYSADRHFVQDPQFEAIAPVVNPMTWEMQEGQPPRPAGS